MITSLRSTPISALYLISAPGSGVVSLEDMKKHLNVDFTDDDDLISAYTEAVTQHLDGRDGWLGRALLEQTWELRLSAFPCEPITVPLPPLIEVESIEYVDGDGNEQTLNAAKYQVTGLGGRGRIYLARNQSWPVIDCSNPEAVIIRFRAGYIDNSSPPEPNVPSPIAAAIKLMVGTLYANRETVVVGQTAVTLPWAAEALLAPYRILSH